MVLVIYVPIVPLNFAISVKRNLKRISQVRSVFVGVIPSKQRHVPVCAVIWVSSADEVTPEAVNRVALRIDHFRAVAAKVVAALERHKPVR